MLKVSVEISFFTKLATIWSTTSEIELPDELLLIFDVVNKTRDPFAASSSESCASPSSKLLTSFTNYSSPLSTVNFGRSESLKSWLPFSNPAASPRRRCSLFSCLALRLLRCFASEKALIYFSLRSISL